MRPVDDESSDDLLGLDGGSGEWARAGRELREADPQRYLQVLTVAQRIVLAHENPLHPDLRAQIVTSKSKASA